MRYSNRVENATIHYGKFDVRFDICRYIQRDLLFRCTRENSLAIFDRLEIGGVKEDLR